MSEAYIYNFIHLMNGDITIRQLQAEMGDAGFTNEQVVRAVEMWLMRNTWDDLAKTVRDMQRFMDRMRK